MSRFRSLRVRVKYPEDYRVLTKPQTCISATIDTQSPDHGIHNSVPIHQ